MSALVIRKRLGKIQLDNRRLGLILALLVIAYILAVIAFIIVY